MQSNIQIILPVDNNDKLGGTLAKCSVQNWIMYTYSLDSAVGSA